MSDKNENSVLANLSVEKQVEIFFLALTKGAVSKNTLGFVEAEQRSQGRVNFNNKEFADTVVELMEAQKIPATDVIMSYAVRMVGVEQFERVKIYHEFLNSF